MLIASCHLLLDHAAVLVNPEVSKVLRATNKAAATLSADSDDTCTRRWTASCPDGEHLTSLFSTWTWLHLLFARLLAVSCIILCSALLLSRLGGGGSWQLCCTFFIQGFVRLSNLLLLAARLLFASVSFCIFSHVLLSRDYAGPCAHAQSFVGKSVNDKRAFVEDCNAPWFACVLRVFRSRF